MSLLHTIRDITVKDLLHDDRAAYKKEGHGGKPLEQWPIYLFFKTYHQGERDDAERMFVEWYIDQYQKYSEVEKARGGMKGGSLDRLKNRMENHADSGELLKESALQRVRQRFQLMDEIRSSGYRPSHDDPVKAYERGGGKYMLFGGHHRAAILAALGFRVVPQVYVYKNKTMYSFHRRWEKMKSKIF